MLIPLRDCAGDARCGGKAARLGTLIRSGFLVPDGFVILDPRSGQWTSRLEIALDRLGPGPYAVRSSARVEDGATASYAGQFRTTLGLTSPGAVGRAILDTTASYDAAVAAEYAARTAARADSGTPAVIVQAMVQPSSAGVMFTRHPVTGDDEVVVEATDGLGDELVDGAVTPQRWVFHPHGRQGSVPGWVLDLARLGARIEALFGRAQDVEWALCEGKVWLLQARPITRLPITPHLGPDALRRRGRSVVTGVAASPGAATGRVRIIGGLDEFARLSPGDVLVCRTTSPAWTPLIARAAAVVTEVGGILAHAAIVAREFGVPAVTAASGAMTSLRDDQVVRVDGTRGEIDAIGEDGPE